MSRTLGPADGRDRKYTPRICERKWCSFVAAGGERGDTARGGQVVGWLDSTVAVAIDAAVLNLVDKLNVSPACIHYSCERQGFAGCVHSRQSASTHPNKKLRSEAFAYPRTEK